jgi:hypothetical protein
MATPDKLRIVVGGDDGISLFLSSPLSVISQNSFLFSKFNLHA